MKPHLSAKKSTLLRFFIGLISLLLFLGVGYAVIDSIFVVRTVECSVGDQPCPETLTQKLNEQFLHSSFIFTNFRNSLLESRFSEESYTLNSFKKYAPSKVVFIFNSESNAYAVQFSDKLVVITESGLIKSEQLVAGLNTVVFAQDSQTVIENNSLPKKFHEPLNSLILALEQERIIIKDITWKSESEIVVQLEAGPRVIVTSLNTTQAIHQVSSILKSNEVQELETPVREIDLRFNLPVLRT